MSDQKPPIAEVLDELERLPRKDLDALEKANDRMERQNDILRDALADILTADETSTVEGAIAIAKAAIEKANAVR